MNRRIVSEIVCWTAAFFFAVFCMSIGPVIPAAFLLPPDFLFALQVFAAYFYSGNKVFVICLLAALIKDTLFGLVLGPAMLSGLLTAYLGTGMFSRRFNRSPLWLFPQGAVLLLLSKFIQTFVFSLLNLPGFEKISLWAWFSGSITVFVRALPGVLAALLLYLLIFRFLWPPGGRDADEAGPAVADLPGKVY